MKTFRQTLLLLPAAAGMAAGLAAFTASASASEHHPFDQWRGDHFTPPEMLDETVSGAHADPAGDGLANLAKYVLGLDPWKPSRDAHPVVIWDFDRPALRFTAMIERPGVELWLGVSDDLLDWEDHLLDENYPHSGSVDVGNGREEITVSPPLAADMRQFLRLEIRLVDSDLPDALLGLWFMDEIEWGGAADRCGNARNAVLDESSKERHLILGNRPGSCVTSPDPSREPTLVPRGDGFALSFDGVNDVAYARDVWGDPVEQNYRITFDFNPRAPLSGEQTVMITTDKFEIRLMQNTGGTHARLRIFRWPTAATTGVAASHWFYEDGADLETWYRVEATVRDGQMEIRVDDVAGSVATYDQSQLSIPHHNAHYLGQTWSAQRPFTGGIDNVRIESLESP